MKSKDLKHNDPDVTVRVSFALEPSEKRKLIITFVTLLTSLFVGLTANVLTFFVKISWGDFSRVLQNYLWFIVIMVTFQFLLVTAIWYARKKNKEFIHFKERLVEAYLSALDKSTLNSQIVRDRPHESTE